jgi:hypothetical protein
MLILRGNHADYPDECGKPANPPYEKGSDPDDKQPDKHFGALHDKAALAYAAAARFQGVVLNVSGDPAYVLDKDGKIVYVLDKKGKKKPKTTRYNASQVGAAVTKLIADDSFKAIYGFSGGGYEVPYVLRALKTKPKKVLSRIERIVVLGVDNDLPKTELDPKHFEVKGVKPGWTMANVDYQSNSRVDSSVVPKGADSHMFGPESLLKKTFRVAYDQLMKEEPYKQCPLPPPDKKTDKGTKPHKGH